MADRADSFMDQQLRVDMRQLIYAVVNAAMGEGLPPEGKVNFAKERAAHPMIVVAAAPKSGSTFLVQTLIKITGLLGVRLCAAYSTNEHDLYLPALCLMNRYGCVSGSSRSSSSGTSRISS